MKLLDLFGNIGSLRTCDTSEIEQRFSDAFSEDALLATKMAFYARNIRGGLGERRTFKIILNYLARYQPEVVLKNLDAIALFGRYDDFYALVHTPVESEMWAYLKSQWQSDIDCSNKGEPISLLAKWLKSANASSPETRRLGKLTAAHFQVSEKTYRQTLTKLRHALKLTETLMSSEYWSDIAYSDVPSGAMMRYQNAFKAHDEARFSAYLKALHQGETLTHSRTLFPYELLEKVGLDLQQHHFHLVDSDAFSDAQWKALLNPIKSTTIKSDTTNPNTKKSNPNTTNSNFTTPTTINSNSSKATSISDSSNYLVYPHSNVLVMPDTSGSMYGRPLCTAIGLTLYFAQHNEGTFHNLFMTFSKHPSLIQLNGATLSDQLLCIPSIVAQTNLEAAFRQLLMVAQSNHLAPSDLPSTLIIVTDMPFEEAVSSTDWSFYKSLAKKYRAHGYQIPTVIFWNVHSRSDLFQATSNYTGVQMASGLSPAIFKLLLANIGKTPYEAMITTLSDPLYDCIQV